VSEVEDAGPPAESECSPNVRWQSSSLTRGGWPDLIALTALEHDLELLTRDRRAEHSYRALGVHFQLLV
jgi:hypothetical protein